MAFPVCVCLLLRVIKDLDIAYGLNFFDNIIASKFQTNYWVIISESDIPDISHFLNNAVGSSAAPGPATPGGGSPVSFDVSAATTPGEDEVEEFTARDMRRLFNVPHYERFLDTQFNVAHQALANRTVEQSTASNYTVLTPDALSQDIRMRYYNPIVKDFLQNDPNAISVFPYTRGNMIPQARVSIADVALNCNKCTDNIRFGGFISLWVHSICNHVNDQAIFCHNCLRTLARGDQYDQVLSILNERGLNATERYMQGQIPPSPHYPTSSESGGEGDNESVISVPDERVLNRHGN